MPIAERREQLLDSALEVLDRQGYAALTVEAISRQAGVTRPVFYAAYDDLDTLLHTLLDRTRDRALAQVLQLLSTTGDPSSVDDWMVKAAAGLIDLVHEHPSTWKPILGLTRGAPALVEDRIHATRELICTYLAAGIEAGLDLRGGPFLDAELLAHAALATAEELGRLALTDPERFTKERMVGAFALMLSSVPPTRARRQDG
ncbi:MAG: TetR/AcrR family transcriptional regulator [Nocardioidaceae bacterium]|nr:TetR/AcrR family transcriptional regulator [Nocardioidaceae bacterium]MCL2614498.1 TetR/AcrR family transcriptional regulator [Nocardioidaceae bacterium]